MGDLLQWQKVPLRRLTQFCTAYLNPREIQQALVGKLPHEGFRAPGANWYAPLSFFANIFLISAFVRPRVLAISQYGALPVDVGEPCTKGLVRNH
jgi:hypothetical protein